MNKVYSEHDPIAHRLVTALEALPVPAAPLGLRAPSKPSLLREPRVVLAAGLLLVLVSVLASPQLQEAAAELTRYIERTLFGPGWMGYYLDDTATDSQGRAVSRLRFATSETPRAPALIPDIIGEYPLANHGQWSPDRQRITVTNANKLYVGDRSGHVRLISTVDPGFEIRKSGWLANDKAWGLVLATQSGSAAAENAAGTPWSFLTVDINTGVTERRILDDFPGRVIETVSPDGRWIPAYSGIGSCGQMDGLGTPRAALYNLVTHETVDVVDGNGRPASLSIGFLRDGRIVVAQCDRTAARMELYVGVPGSRPALIAVVSTTVLYPIAISDSGNDEILVLAQGPDEPQTASVFDPSGRLIRTVRVPRLSQFGTNSVIDQAGLSSDGKFMSFVITESQGAPFVQFVTRAGVLDLTTGQVTYLCDGGCHWLLLR